MSAILNRLRRNLRGIKNSKKNQVRIFFDNRNLGDFDELDDINVAVGKKETLQALQKAKLPEWYIQSPFGNPRTDNIVEIRKLAQMGIVQRCIDYRLDQIFESPWDIVAIDKKDDSEETKNLAKEVKNYLKDVNDNGKTYFEELRKVETDKLEVGEGIVIKSFEERVSTTVNSPGGPQSIITNQVPAGHLIGIQAYDVSQFNILQTIHGKTLGYWQFNFVGSLEVESVPQFFTPREYILFQDQLTTYDPYGRSRIKEVKEFLETVFSQVLQIRNFYQKGAIFQGILKTAGLNNESKDIIDKFMKEKFRSMTHKFAIFHGGKDTEIDFVPLMLNIKDLAFLDGLDFVQRFVASVYKVPPNELGITDNVNKAVADEQAQLFKRQVVGPEKKKIKDKTDKFVLSEFDPDNKIEFIWIEELDLKSKKIEQEIIDSRIDRNIITINEVRQEQGMKPFEEDWANKPLAILQMEKMEKAQELQQQQLQDNNNGSDGPIGPNGPGFQQDKQDQEDKKKETIDKSFDNPIKKDHADPKKKISKKEIEDIILSKVGKSKTIDEVLSWKGLKDVDKEQVSRVILDLVDEEKIDISGAASAEQIKTSTRSFGRIHGRGVKVEPKKRGPVDPVDPDKKLDKNLAIAIDPLIEELYTKLKAIFETWEARLGRLEITEDTIPPEITEMIENVVNVEELAAAITDSMFESYEVGLRLDNEGKPRDPSIFNLPDKKTMDYIQSYPLIIAERVTDRVAFNYKFDIIEGLSRGESISKVRKRLKETNEDLKTYEADRIARTEIINAMSWGRINQLREFGQTKWKFYATLDERLCPICREHHGKTYDIDDLEHKPPKHPNCRCAVLSVVGDELSEGKSFHPSKKQAEIELQNGETIVKILGGSLVEGKTVREIATDLGNVVSYQTVNNWVRDIFKGEGRWITHGGHRIFIDEKSHAKWAKAATVEINNLVSTFEKNQSGFNAMSKEDVRKIVNKVNAIKGNLSLVQKLAQIGYKKGITYGKNDKNGKLIKNQIFSEGLVSKVPLYHGITTGHNTIVKPSTAGDDLYKNLKNMITENKVGTTHLFVTSDLDVATDYGFHVIVINPSAVKSSRLTLDPDPYHHSRKYDTEQKSDQFLYRSPPDLAAIDHILLDPANFEVHLGAEKFESFVSSLSNVKDYNEKTDSFLKINPKDFDKLKDIL